jgi:hypothetical protein
LTVVTLFAVSYATALRVGNPDIQPLVKGLHGKVLGTTSGQGCKTPGTDCRQMYTVMLAMQSPGKQDFEAFGRNLVAQGWQYSGAPLTSPQITRIYKIVSVNFGGVNTKSAAKDAGAQAFGLFTAAFFGEQSYLTKNRKVLSVVVDSDDGITSDSDRLYDLQALVPAPPQYDFSKAIQYIHRSPRNYVVFIAVSK